MTDDNSTSSQYQGRHGADDFFIQGVATGKSVATAARLAGISRRTAFRRMQDPDILRQISDMRSQLTDLAVDKLVNAAEPACQTLSTLLAAPSDQVKLSAARTILREMVSVRNVHELDSRLQEVEADRAEKTSPSAAQCYWPDTLEQGPPASDGLDISQGYRHKANWLDYIIYNGGLPDEKVQELKQQIAELRDAAQRYDAAIAS